MLTSIGWAAARRTLFSSSSRAARSSRLAQVAPKSPISRTVLPIRTFTASTWTEQPAAGTKESATGAAEKKATKKAAKPKAKAKPKKAATPKKKKKALTPEEKEKVELRELKKMALLKGPPTLPSSAWSVYVANNMRSGEGTLSEKIKTVSADFKNLSGSEKERLKTLGQENAVANQDSRRAWIDSHPPEAIYMANIARRRLGRKLSKNRVYLIHDDRLPKRAGTPYTLFIKARFPKKEGEGSAQDIFRSISVEWKNLSESEKRPYQDMAAAEAAHSRDHLRELREKGKAYWKGQQQGSATVKDHPSP